MRIGDKDFKHPDLYGQHAGKETAAGEIGPENQAPSKKATKSWLSAGFSPPCPALMSAG